MKLKGVVVGLPCFPNDSSIPPAPLAIHNRSVGVCERDGGSVNGVAKERIGGRGKTIIAVVAGCAANYKTRPATCCVAISGAARSPPNKVGGNLLRGPCSLL